MTDLQLQCACGKLHGVAHIKSPESGVRLVCYCRDCQAFAEHLKCTGVVDEYGGTDLYQMAPADFEITSGHENIRGLRLSDNGLFRWYAGCCNTPLANTVSARFPLVSIFHRALEPTSDHTPIIGSIRGHVNKKGARGQIPDADGHPAMFWITVRILQKLAGWKLRGKTRPSAFFTPDGAPVSNPTILQSSKE